MPTGIYVDDIVVELDRPDKRGEVSRVANDPFRPAPLGQDVDVLRHGSVNIQQYQHFLEQAEPPLGTAIVIFEDSTQLIATSKLHVLQRFFELHDIVMRPGDVMTGVVLDTTVMCTLQSIATAQLDDNTKLLLSSPQSHRSLFPPSTSWLVDNVDNVPASELQRCEDLNDEDIVIYKDWVGIVGDTASAVSIRLINNSVVEVQDSKVKGHDLETTHYHVGDLVRATKATLRTGKWIYGQYSPNVEPRGTVVDVRRTALKVSWICAGPRTNGPAPDSELERLDLESNEFTVYRLFARPDVITNSATSGKESFPHDNVEWPGERVRFIDPVIARDKYGSQLTFHSRADNLGYDMNVLSITHFRSTVRVLWQDCTISQHDSTDLVADHSVEDTHSAWPGEIAYSIDRNKVPGLSNVTSPNKVGVVQSVDADERMAIVKWCPSADVQYISLDEEEGAKEELVQEIVGLAAGEPEKVSLYELELPGDLNVGRGDMVLIDNPDECGLKDVKGINWFGAIVDDRLDGALTIRLGAARPVQDVVLLREQVSVVMRFGEFDAEDSELDDYDSDYDMDGSDVSGDTEYDAETLWHIERAERTVYMDAMGNPMDKDEAENDEWESADDNDEQEGETQNQPMQDSPGHGTELVEDEPSRYVLHGSEVPGDHHFSSAPAPAASTRMKQIQKEHRIFQKRGAVPDGVHVHSWEARLDLWRVLLIGPQDTPYAGAPFIVDFYLPTDYPFSPPQAFFHSWSGQSGLGATGPVNPNLYEDGKICLSLLGTWSGEQRENWTPMSSTLLQVVVSLQGLVLVKEPYFNEAGYEDQVGTDSAKRPSILYNERVVLRSLNFAISAVGALQTGRLLSGMADLEPVIRWLYLAPNGACLFAKLQRRCQRILSASSSSCEAVDGLNVLSQGACISLRRVLTRLEELQKDS